MNVFHQPTKGSMLQTDLLSYLILCQIGSRTLHASQAINLVRCMPCIKFKDNNLGIQTCDFALW